MSRFYFRLLPVAFAVFCMAGAFAQDPETSGTSAVSGTTTTTTVQPTMSGTGVTKTVVTRHTVTTTYPAANAVVTSPAGYVSCLSVDAGWQADGWVPAHKVCTYSNSPLGKAWVEGYWECTNATDDGVCLVWAWKDAHWEQTYP